MSLTKVTLSEIVKKQFQFKLNAYSGIYLSLVVLQLLAILFSLNGVGMSGGGSNQISYSVNFYSGDVVIGFTLLWSFIVSMIITTRAYRNDDFTFISNRLSSDLSNFLFLLSISFIGAITALLSGFLLKLVLFLLPNFEVFHYTSVAVSPSLVLLGFFTTFLYIMLLASLGYFVGTLVRLHVLFKTLIPALFFGFLFLGGIMGEVGAIPFIFSFFFTETSPAIFMIKVMVTIAILLSSSVWIFNKVEVRQ